MEEERQRCDRCKGPFSQHQHLHTTRKGTYHTNCYIKIHGKIPQEIKGSTEGTLQSPSQEEKDFTMTKRPQHEQDMMQKEWRKECGHVLGEEGKLYKDIFATPSQSWEEEFETVWKESLVSSRSDVGLEGKNVKQFIKTLLTSREELLKQRCKQACLEEIGKGKKNELRDSSSVEEEAIEYGYNQALSDAKEAVTRVFVDE